VFAALAGLVYAVIIKNKEKYLPFVPFIYAGTMLAYFLGDYILNYYNSIL
jgi:prepilin signal peptidase PulO-like enzyme (type II secretory pathway)